MNVRNCRSCGRLFNYVAGTPLCPVCRDKLEEKFQIVKEYIRDNPGVGMQQVSEECDVEMSVIQQWLREERLEVTENSAIYLNCESCGQPIRSGRFCDKCKTGMMNGFRQAMGGNNPAPAQPAKPDRDNPRMRFL